MTQAQIITAIRAERRRQDRRFGIRSIGSKSVNLDTKLRILVEEVGEVARAIDLIDEAQQTRGPHALLGTRRQNLRDELVQVAACAVGMLESL